MAILDAHGRPIHSQPKARHELADALPARMRAGFDAARDTDEFRNYWANADALDADSAHSKAIRDKLIRRSRYEVANNGYADGMVQTHANFLVGRGPSLQVKTRSRAFNEMVETTWRAWSRAIRLRRKLWCMAHAKVQDGEAFAIIRENRGVRHDVQLDLVLIEAEQCTTPFLPFGMPGRIDGIEFDQWGNPVLYDILPQHPGGAWGFSFSKPERVPARWVLHWFHLRRPGQHRAVPEFCSTLNCGAAARRWREATIAAAETAAEFSALLKTTMIPENEADPVAPMSAMEFQKRMVVALPMGWEAQQMKGEHPSTTFAEFHKANISEQARPKSQPYNLAAADSSSHNYASGRLDHQTYYLTLDVEREDANDMVLDPLFAEWFPVAARVFGWDRPNVLPPHEWSWPRYPIVDLRTEASSQTEHLKNGTLSLRRAYEESGLDFDEALPQMAEDYGVDEDEMRAILRKALFGGNGGAGAENDGDASGMEAPQRMAAHSRTLVAAQKADDRVLALSADVEIKAAEASPDGEQPGPRRFDVVAYTGGDLLLNGWDLPVVIDLRGLSAAKSIVANLHHDSRLIVGHVTERKNDGAQLVLSGVVSGTGEGAREFIANHDNGFPWQASVEARPEKVVEIRAGRTVTVNGREYTGPLLVARKAKLYGIAFVPRGADENSSVTLAASQRKARTMNEFDQWIEAMGFVADDLTEQQKTALRATFDREIAARAKDDDDDEPVRLAVPAFDLDEIKAAAAEHYADLEVAFTEYEADVRDPKRLAEIRAEASKGARELKAQAIRERWPATRFEVEAIKAKAKVEKELILAQTPAGPAIHASTRDAGPKVIEAALCLARNMPDVEKHYDEPTLEAAHKGFRNFGVQRLLLTAAAANGYHCGPGERIDAGNIRAVLKHAFPPIQAAGFSTLSVPDILSNLANKELLMGFQEEDQTWREISRVTSVNDFKQHSSHRMLDDMEYEELGPKGEIKHGELGEEKFTRQVRTYAKMFTLSREDIINDDLGAFDDLRNRIGRGAARKFNNVFWSRFMDNASFFTAARGNYKTGTGTALGVDGAGLQEGILLFRKLKSPDGKRLGGVPTILLVPPELQFVAQRLFQSTTVNTGGAATAESVPSDNIHAGKYRPVVVDWLSDSDFSGSSAKAWYLFRAPSVLAPVVVSFLFGNQAPTVESAEADFNQLGVQFRGYHDFGVDLHEWLAGVKLKGEN